MPVIIHKTDGIDRPVVLGANITVHGQRRLYRESESPLNKLALYNHDDEGSDHPRRAEGPRG
jgi:hypothetical protein